MSQMQTASEWQVPCNVDCLNLRTKERWLKTSTRTRIHTHAAPEFQVLSRPPPSSTDRTYGRINSTYVRCSSIAQPDGTSPTMRRERFAATRPTHTRTRTTRRQRAQSHNRIKQTAHGRIVADAF
eukprot:scaffold33786_cov124-Isochrysis_galbana.AAC.3